MSRRLRQGGRLLILAVAAVLAAHLPLDWSVVVSHALAALAGAAFVLAAHLARKALG